MLFWKKKKKDFDKFAYQTMVLNAHTHLFMFFFSFFMCWGTSFGITARHSQHARTTKGFRPKGELLQCLEWKVEKIKHKLSISDLF